MNSLKTLTTVALAVSVSALQLTAPYGVSNPTTACQILKRTYPNITYLPDDAGYTAENQGQFRILALQKKRLTDV